MTTLRSEQLQRSEVDRLGGTFKDLTREQRRALGLISISQLLALSLWFSATAVAGQLVDEWSLSASGEAALTLSVQVGFVAGALGLAILNIADIFPSRRIFFFSAMAGSLANFGLLLISADIAWVAFVLRFATGVALAGVYPSGLKVMAGWFREGRGMALGVLVGALTVGSASPHLTRGLGLDWPGVVVASSVLAAAAGFLMTMISDGGPGDLGSMCSAHPSRVRGIALDRAARALCMGIGRSRR